MSYQGALDCSSATTEVEMVDDDEVVRDRKFLVFESSLLQLLKRCTRCGHDVQCKTSTRGTLLVVDGSCPDGHEFHWESQPSVRGMAAGNLLLLYSVV